MAIKPVQDFTSTTLYEARDGFRLQRFVGGIWRDYQISALRLFGDPQPTEAVGTEAGYISRVFWTTLADTIGSTIEIFPDPGVGKAWVVVDCAVFYSNGTNFAANNYYRLYRASDSATVARGKHDAATGSILVGLSHEVEYQFLEQSAIYFETESITPVPDGELSLLAYAVKVDV